VAVEAFGRDIGKFFDERDTHDWALGQPAFKEQAEAYGPPDVPAPTDVAALLFRDLSAGSGPMLRLMDLEMRLRNTLTGLVKQLKELRALRRQQAVEEREAEEDGGVDEWEPGEWDNDPARFGRYFDDDGDAYEDAQADSEPADHEARGDDEGDGGGAETSPGPAPQCAAPRNNSPPPAQNEPTAEKDVPPAPAAAQPQAAAPDALPAPPGISSESPAPPAETEPTKATATDPAPAPPLVTGPLPTEASRDGSIDPGT
jgi:hypothetical protein